MPNSEPVPPQDPITEPPPGPLQLCELRGFKFPVFISWPHKMQSRGAEIVHALASALENRFRDEGCAPVFFDNERLKPSYIWDETLRISACRSAVTIVFLLRTYFLSEYCCTEWAICEELAKRRVAANKHRLPIIPILMAKNVPLPREVGKIQFEDDFQQLLVYGRDPTTHDKWNLLVEGIVEQVFELIADVCETERDWATEEQLALNAKPKRFTWPVQSGSGAPQPEQSPRPRSVFPSIRVEKPAA
jgi:hypothetical protein